ncbi:hypothetical protein ACH4XT_02150 [Streptomyces avidinii]|uniref:hypothetical protein n=1 Tax=Streptomyces avidinii TaxID=1895 RepID=UPI0037A501AD
MPTDRELPDTKVVRTVNVNGTVWDAGKTRTGEDEVSISHVVVPVIEVEQAPTGAGTPGPRQGRALVVSAGQGRGTVRSKSRTPGASSRRAAVSSTVGADSAAGVGSPTAASTTPGSGSATRKPCRDKRLDQAQLAALVQLGVRGRSSAGSLP